MKRPYSHKPSAPQALWAFGLVVLVLLIVLVSWVFMPGVVLTIASPFWKVGNSFDTSIANMVSGFENKEVLAKNNSMLIAQNTLLTQENAVLTTRSQDLIALLGGQVATGTAASNSQSSQNGIPAGVLARPPESPYDTLVVAAGTDNGVAVGAQVFSQGGIPIGTIKHETQGIAQVSLYSSPGRATDGWVGENRTPLTLTGTGGGTFSSILPKTTPVSVGDTVYFPGPGAIPIGTVTGIDSPDSSTNVVLHIEPLVNLFSVTWVLIAR